MVFWTWAKGLEDAFDGRNRKNLRQFIMPTDDTGDSTKFHLVDHSTITREDYGDENDLAGQTVEKNTSVPSLYYVSSFAGSKKQALSKLNSRDEKSLGSESDTEELHDVEERRELVRINTCAVFHKLSPGKGVPHSFIGFIRHWPSLPRVVVRSLSLHSGSSY